MIVPGCLWRSVLIRQSRLPYTVQCARKVPCSRLAYYGSLLYMDSMRRRALGTPLMCVNSLYTGRFPLKALNEPKKREPVETAGRDSKENETEDGSGTSLEKVSKVGMEIGFYFVAISLGFVAVSMVVILLKELFDPISPLRLYRSAFAKCRNHPEVIEICGEPINDYGLYPPKLRKQHYSVVQYTKNKRTCLRLTFYISGSKVKCATVHVDLRKSPVRRMYDVRYIIVDIESDPPTSIIVEDNRYDRY